MDQRPPSTSQPDVVIVGGGVAGGSLAIVLRRAGIVVHLVERSDRFRDRIRGETIHPWGVNHVRAIGLYDLLLTGAHAQEQRIWQRYIDREPAEPSVWAERFPQSPNGLGVAHVELQEAILAEAIRLGTVVHRPAEVRFERARDRPRLTIAGPAGDVVLAPRLVVGADGEGSATRRWMGGTRSADPTHHSLGGVLVRGLGLASDRIHHAYFSGGMILASPLSDNRARVYIICDLERAAAMQRSAHPAQDIVDQFRASAPAGLLGDDWAAIGPAGFFPNAAQVVDIPPSRDVVLVGDASGRNDPSQGHGLSLVFRDVHELGDLLTDGTPWDEVPDHFHRQKARDFEVLRQHAHWLERQATETGPAIDALKDRIARAREADPSAGGFAGIFATGPAGLDASEQARRHFLGEDLQPGPATISRA